MPRSKGHGGERWRAHKVPRDPLAYLNRDRPPEPPRPTIVEDTRYGRVTARAIDCSHGVPWTTCTICSKPRSK